MKTKIVILSIVFLFGWVWCGSALAFDPGDSPNWQDVFDECPEDRCGSPPSGGDGGGGGGPLIVSYTWGPTFSVQEDFDADGWNDEDDNCKFDQNDPSENDDGDMYGNICDNCPNVANDDQADNEGDGIGDVCDDNDDYDTIADASDNCPFVTNEDQSDMDGDDIGDACDTDIDGDTIPNLSDICPENADVGREAIFSYMNGYDAQGDPCDTGNVDRDEYADNGDGCRLLHARANSDSDGDSIADACDNCPNHPNNDQADSNHNGIGDSCE